MWIERLARFGYATKGVVYILIGMLAVLVAFNAGGKTTGSSGALRTIAEQPYGRFLLILIAIGLLGYALWRWVQAVKDPDHKGNDFKGLATRAGYILSGLIYAGLAFEATKLVLNFGGNGDGDSREDWTAQLLSQPFGQWLAGTVGAVIVGVGFYRIYRAWKIKFRKSLNLQELDQNQTNLVVQVCRAGIVARGIVYVLLGFFLIQAAYQFDPEQVKGMDELFQTVARQPLGKVLLLLIALGMIAYGIYMEIQARYRRIDAS
ncbi:MAG: DUF1206 domain-containing protein [Oscillatoriales cyanobacterium RM2_1_1]|nr:DUF1206 domain-containing protein [Oscillatoriales cyanobacterium RM2_1_1]